MCYDILKDDNPGQTLTAVAIAGGPACDWERTELRNNFGQKLPNFKLKQIGDFEDDEVWLERQFRWVRWHGRWGVGCRGCRLDWFLLCRKAQCNIAVTHSFYDHLL